MEKQNQQKVFYLNMKIINILIIKIKSIFYYN
jgi:hypothetical protein